MDRVALTRQVKEANDIVAVVESYIPLHPAGATFKAVCPFHNDTRPSLDVDPRRQRFRCWACGKFGDVFSFVQEYEKVDFLQARSILAARVGISLDDEHADQDNGRLRFLRAAQWAAQRYHEFLVDHLDAERARHYVGQRGLTGLTVREFLLGFAPPEGDWLVQAARRDRIDLHDLVEVGLISTRKQSNGFYDRFRDRLIFPIRDVRGQTIAFGGRILPSAPTASHSPKYYNSSETPLFSKSEVLYGLDQARRSASQAGFIAVVEGYTDVLMAHQCGVPNVVATMGTALTARHVAQLRRFAPRVVLLFDADEGGLTGVDRALELFISQDVDLAISTLPENLDPYDYLLERGGEAFTEILNRASDALDFKLDRLLNANESTGVEGTRRVIDGILGILARAPEMPGQSGRLKCELVVTRLTRRLGLRQETVWARLRELTEQHRRRDERYDDGPTEPAPKPTSAPAPALERQLIEVLLAEPQLVREACTRVSPEELTHVGLRKLYQCLVDLHHDGQVADLDAIRDRLNHPALAKAALSLQDRGRDLRDRSSWLAQILRAFEQGRLDRVKEEVRSEISRTLDHDSAVELLRKLQAQSGLEGRPSSPAEDCA